MASGIWTAVSGAAAKAQSVDTVANNLANQDTLAFKKDLPAFREYLTHAEREHEGVDIPRGRIRDRDFHPLDGRDQAFVIVDGTYSNFKQGNLKVTQAPLDLALDGPGFFEVSTPSGIRYTRQGSFKLATDGRLVTSEGYPVLTAQPGGLAPALPATATQPSQGGLLTQGGVAAEANRFLSLKDRAGPITFTQEGEVYDGEDLIAKIAVREFKDLNQLRKQGSALFDNKNPTNLSNEKSRSILRQGVLETSNVNPIEEMTNLIRANRMYEFDLKSIKTFNEMMGKEANEIGKL